MAADGASAAGAAVGWKLIGGLAGLATIGSALATMVVLCMSRPKDDREWCVALVSTLISSIGGGSAMVMHFGLQGWAHDPFGLMALLGLAFACGLPGWATVRWVFNWMDKRAGKDIGEVIGDVRRIGLATTSPAPLDK